MEGWGGGRQQAVWMGWEKKEHVPEYFVTILLLTAPALLLNLTERGLESSVILMTWRVIVRSGSVVVWLCLAVRSLCECASLRSTSACEKEIKKKKQNHYNQQASCVFAGPIKSHSFANEGPVEVLTAPGGTQTCSQHTCSPQQSSAPPTQSSARTRCCVPAALPTQHISPAAPRNTKKYNWIHYFPFFYGLFRCGFNLSCKRWGRLGRSSASNTPQFLSLSLSPWLRCSVMRRGVSRVVGAVSATNQLLKVAAFVLCKCSERGCQFSHLATTSVR